MSDQPVLSVIVLNLNAKEDVVRCLQSLFIHAGDLPMTVYMVDDGSTDGTVDLVRSGFPQVQILENQLNLGIAKSRNRALREVRTPYVLSLDCDTVLRAGTCQHLLAFLKEHPTVGVVGAKIQGIDGFFQSNAGYFPSLLQQFLHWTGISSLLPTADWVKPQHLRNAPVLPLELDWVGTGCCMFRSCLMEQVGYFDEMYVYGEDADWCYRVKREGWGVYFLPEAEAVHRGGSSGVLWSEKICTIMDNFYFHFDRYHGRMARLVVKAMTIAGLIPRVAIFRLAGGLVKDPKYTQKAIWFQRLLLANFGIVSRVRTNTDVHPLHRVQHTR